MPPSSLKAADVATYFAKFNDPDIPTIHAQSSPTGPIRNHKMKAEGKVGKVSHDACATTVEAEHSTLIFAPVSDPTILNSFYSLYHPAESEGNSEQRIGAEHYGNGQVELEQSLLDNRESCPVTEVKFKSVQKALDLGEEVSLLNESAPPLQLSQKAPAKKTLTLPHRDEPPVRKAFNHDSTKTKGNDGEVKRVIIAKPEDLLNSKKTRREKSLVGMEIDYAALESIHQSRRRPRKKAKVEATSPKQQSDVDAVTGNGETGEMMSEDLFKDDDTVLISRKPAHKRPSAVETQPILHSSSNAPDSAFSPNIHQKKIKPTRTKLEKIFAAREKKYEKLEAE